MGYICIGLGFATPLHAIIYHNMDLKSSGSDKMLENLMLICSLFLLEFQWNNLYFA